MNEPGLFYMICYLITIACTGQDSSALLAQPVSSWLTGSALPSAASLKTFGQRAAQVPQPMHVSLFTEMDIFAYFLINN
jgi:hypothetical protein